MTMSLKSQLSRRTFLKGIGLAGAVVRVGLPPLAWAAEKSPVESRFVLWFNGNGIPERYWIPSATGPGFELTPCLAPLGPCIARLFHHPNPPATVITCPVM